MQSGGNSTAPGEPDEASDWDGEERRAADRREAPTHPISGLLSHKRRLGGRRQADHSSYVDRYSRWDVGLILAIFLMNVGDAFLTLLWLSRGGREANPVMDFFLDIGPGAFLIQKCIVVGIWLLVLIVHKNFRIARIGIYASLVVYALIMMIHFGIIALGIEPVPVERERTEAATEQAAPDARATLDAPGTMGRIAVRESVPPAAE